MNRFFDIRADRMHFINDMIRDRMGSTDFYKDIPVDLGTDVDEEEKQRLLLVTPTSNIQTLTDLQNKKGGGQ